MTLKKEFDIMSAIGIILIIFQVFLYYNGYNNCIKYCNLEYTSFECDCKSIISILGAYNIGYFLGKNTFLIIGILLLTLKKKPRNNINTIDNDDKDDIIKCENENKNDDDNDHMSGIVY